MATVATPTPAHIRELEDIRAGDLDSTQLLTILHWRLLNTTAPQFIDHAEAETQLTQILAALHR
jgi:hypothetical protein